MPLPIRVLMWPKIIKIMLNSLALHLVYCGHPLVGRSFHVGIEYVG